MTLLKFKSSDRKYDVWDLYHNETNEVMDKSIYNICPIRDKLFNQDTIMVDDKRDFVEIIHSCNRTEPTIPAILSFNKMYGKTLNNKYYFKATPDDIRVPEFIVPYKMKNAEFVKKAKNKYVIIKYEHWKEKHPVGSIICSIGDVEILPHFYEYMLYCKSLNSSLQQFTRNTMLFLKNTNEENHILRTLNNPKYNIQKRHDWNVICIDPAGSKDFDDGFSVKEVIYNKQDCILLSIYIANVPIWLDSMNLWESFSERISTIYLPDRKRPMLPSILSDKLCSLQSGKIRFAFTLDIYIDKSYTIIHNEFHNTAINITGNYEYGDIKGLLNDTTYIKTFDLVSNLNHHTKYKHIDKIVDSHDIVAYLMVLMNYISAIDLKAYQSGIFRTIKMKSTAINIPLNIPPGITQFLKGWNSTGGKYVKFKDYEGHELLNLDAYVHITSPIRRIVDILNIMSVMENHNMNGFTNNEGAIGFFNKWTGDNKFEYINVSMRSIRRLQNKCELLERCYTNPNILSNHYKGYCFDKLRRSDGFYQYVVYIPEMKIINKYTGDLDVDNFTEQMFQLYLFKDESTFKQKIKMNLV